MTGIAGGPHRPQTLPQKPLDGWQGCHCPSLPPRAQGAHSWVPKSRAAVLPESSGGKTVHGSEVTLYPQATPLLSFTSEQDSEESDTQTPGAHGPEIHTFLSSQEFCNETLGAAPSLLQRRQNRQGHDHQRVQGRLLQLSPAPLCTFNTGRAEDGLTGWRLPPGTLTGPSQVTLERSKDQKEPVHPVLPSPSCPLPPRPPSLCRAWRPSSSMVKTSQTHCTTLRAPHKSQLLSCTQKGALHTPATGPILPHPFSASQTPLEPPRLRAMASFQGPSLRPRRNPYPQTRACLPPASYEFSESWSGPLAP